MRRGEILGIAASTAMGRPALVYALTGLVKPESWIHLFGRQDITHASIRPQRSWMSHILRTSFKHGLVLDYTLAENLILKSYSYPEFQRGGFLRFDAMYDRPDAH